MLVPLLDPNVVISPAYVEFQKDVCVFDLCDQFQYQWQGIFVSDSILIQLPVVLYWA